MPKKTVNRGALQIHGHRGAMGLFPENSLLAIKAGIDAGCDAIEVDLCVTADNQLVIHHDLKLSPRLVRDASGQWVTENTRIREQTLKQIKTYDIGRLNPDGEYAARFHSQQAVDGTRIPTLEEFVALVKAGNRKVIYNIELKNSDDSKDTPAVPDYVDLVVEALKKHDIVERVFLQSFNLQLVTEAKSRLPELKIGWITRPEQGGISPAEVLKGTSINPDFFVSARKSRTENRSVYDIHEDLPMNIKKRGLTPQSRKKTVKRGTLESMVIKGVEVWSSHQQGLNADSVRLAHDLGLEVYAWTVNSEQDMRRMIDLSVDAITTDYPNRLFALLNA